MTTWARFTEREWDNVQLFVIVVVVSVVVNLTLHWLFPTPPLPCGGLVV